MERANRLNEGTEMARASRTGRELRINRYRKKVYRGFKVSSVDMESGNPLNDQQSGMVEPLLCCLLLECTESLC